MNTVSKEVPVGIDIVYPRGKSGPWVMDVKIGDEKKEVPVFHCREDSHKEEIAQQFAANKVCVAFGVGNYGVAILLDDPRRGRYPDAWKGFSAIKPTREDFDKVPIFISPRDLHKVVDFDTMHPEFAKLLRDRGYRERLWREGVSFHLVAPVPKDAHYIHPVLITTPEDLKRAGKPAEQMVNVNTASVFRWHDPDWQEIEDLVTRFNPFGIAGISSFNEHGEQSAYTFDEVVEWVVRKRRCPFDFVVRDEVGEAIGVRSSHPQIRIPLRHELPEWIGLRHGAISFEGWLRAVDSPFGIRVLPTAKVAARATPPNVNLDGLVFQVREETLESYRLRHPNLRVA